MFKIKYKKIKIFVSQRNDLNSSLVKNPIFCNVTCGASKRKILRYGDNSGENISYKANKYSEYSVLYWVWKNFNNLDYIGLCHYRRFLVFKHKKFQIFRSGHEFYDGGNLNLFSMIKYGLFSYSHMRKVICDNDAIVNKVYSVKSINLQPRAKNLRELFLNHPNVLITEDRLELLCKIVQDKFSEYYDTLHYVLDQDTNRGFNLFVFKRDIFNKFCDFLFPVLFEMESKNTSELFNKRELGYLGEILYNTFVCYLIKNKYKVKELPVVFFTDTQKYSIKNNFSKIFKNLKIKIFSSYYRSKKKIEELKVQNDLILKKLDKVVTYNQISNQRLQKLFFSLQPSFSCDQKLIKEQFWRNYPKATGDLKIIQDGQMLLLSIFNKLCKQIGVNFWLHGGSLIGAIRHQSMVPWDDDIDVAMTRDDFELLRNNLCKLKKFFYKGKEVINDFFIQEYYYVDLGCRSYRFHKHGLKLFVDIFIYDICKLKFDNISDNWFYLRNQKRFIKKSYNDFANQFNLIKRNDCVLKSNYKEIFDYELDYRINAYKSERSSSKKYVVWGLDNNYEGPGKFAWEHGRIFLTDDIFPLVSCTYNNEMYFVPNNYEFYAYSEYGIQINEMHESFGLAVHYASYFNSRKILNDIYKWTNDMS